MKVIRTAALVAAASAAYSKAREYARENPDKAGSTIDKAESFVRGKAGPKYADKVGKGSQALRQSLGLPRGASAPSGTPTASSTSPASPADAPATTEGVASSGAPAGFDPAI